MMFQSYALFPHLNVEANIAFGLKQEGLPKAEIAARVADMLALVQARQVSAAASRTNFPAASASAWRWPVRWSSGRALLLLDEPMAALDKKLRGETQFELMELQRRLGLTFIIVTHDQSEAMTVADRIARDGSRPADAGRAARRDLRAAELALGRRLHRRASICSKAASALDGASVEGTAAGRLQVAAKIDAEPGATVWVAVRPEKLRIAPSEPGRSTDGAGQLHRRRRSSISAISASCRSTSCGIATACR